MIIGQVQHDENNLGGIHSGLISAQRGGNKKTTLVESWLFRNRLSGESFLIWSGS